MSKNRLIYLPLGGAGEIGMNAYVYGYGAPGKERLILVDLGVTFPDMETTPGVDLIMADVSWLVRITGAPSGGCGRNCACRSMRAPSPRITRVVRWKRRGRTRTRS